MPFKKVYKHAYVIMPAYCHLTIYKYFMILYEVVVSFILFYDLLIEG